MSIIDLKDGDYIEKRFQQHIAILARNYRLQRLNENDVEIILGPYKKWFNKNPKEALITLEVLMELESASKIKIGEEKNRIQQEREEEQKRLLLQKSITDGVSEGLIRYEMWKESREFSKKFCKI